VDRQGVYFESKKYRMITVELILKIQEQFRINWYGRHGISHWARVYDIGMKLAEETGGDRGVVQLFALFHDSCRYNEHFDPRHGPRGAELAAQLRSHYFPGLTGEKFDLLYQACCLHTTAATHNNITVQTCFDADRLDLGRVRKKPKAKFLCTDAAKSKEMIAWAYQRSVKGAVPENILGTMVV